MNHAHEQLHEPEGGELADWLGRLRGTRRKCEACRNEFTITTETELWGFRHTDGLADEDGTAWWVYVRCPDCEFEITLDLLGR